RMIAASKGIVVQANVFGKIKTILQDISLPLLMLMNTGKLFEGYEFAGYSSSIYYTDVVWIISVIVFGFAVIMTIISGIIYLVQNKKVFESK
ncbi:MAG: hypothetical protein OSJ68_06920, partial [Clostridia bacterium]|nr:hypothetical protein [Clostridia bacterium]